MFRSAQTVLHLSSEAGSDSVPR